MESRRQQDRVKCVSVWARNCGWRIKAAGATRGEALGMRERGVAGGRSGVVGARFRISHASGSVGVTAGNAGTSVGGDSGAETGKWKIRPGPSHPHGWTHGCT